MTCHKQIHKIKSKSDHADFERYEEIFAEMLVHKFIFNESHKTYFRNYLARYSLDPIAYCKEDLLAFIRAFEVLLRGFLITDPFRKEPNEKCVYSGNRTDWDSVASAAFERFYEAVEDAGPFFFDFKHHWKSRSKETIKKYFTPEYKKAYYPVCFIWNDVQRVYDIVCNGNEKKGIRGTDPELEHRDKLIEMIEQGYNSGRPLIRVLYEDQRVSCSDEKDSRLDPFFLMRHLLRAHISEIYGEKKVDPTNCEVTLLRDLNGKPIEPPDGRKLHTWLLDRTLNDILSIVPESRQKSMQNRVTVIKTLWDISTNLRARRMKDMLDLYEEKQVQNQK